MKTTILGVDPGSRITGFGVIETDGEHLTHIRHGVILLDEKASFSIRMGQLAESIRELLAKHRPQYVVLEKIFLGKNADSAFKLGHARGVLMAECVLAGAIIEEYAARQVKKGVTGSGAASKEDVQAVVKNLLGLSQIQKIDTSDALALACYHVFESRKARLMSRAVESWGV